MRFHFKPEEISGTALRSSKVTIGIESNPRPVYLTEIVAREVRRGWVTLEIPPLERWEELLRWLTAPQRERIEEPDFFELLQREIPKGLLALQFR